MFEEILKSAVQVERWAIAGIMGALFGEMGVMGDMPQLLSDGMIVWVFFALAVFVDLSLRGLEQQYISEKNRD